MNPHYWKVDALQKFWFLILLALLVINGALITMVQMLFVYRYEGAATTKVISDWDEQFLGSTILDTRAENQLTTFLLRTQGGETYVVTMERHPFLGRCRIVIGATGKVADGEAEHTERGVCDSCSVYMTIEDQQITQYSVTNFSILVFGRWSMPMVYVLWGSVLIVIEGIACWQLNKALGKEE